MTKQQQMTRVPRSVLCAAVLFGVLILSAHTSQATLIIGDAVLLSDLISSEETVIVGDKKFDQFAYSHTGDMPPSNAVNVIPIMDDDGNFGLRFQAAFVDFFSTAGGSDANIEYRVMVTDPEKLISDAHLQGNPELLGGTGLISVVETFLPIGGDGENTMTIFDDEGAGTKLVDWTYFNPPIMALNVQKDILAIATQTSSVTMSFVDQTFSQTPEPTTMTLLAMAGATVCWTGRRRRRSRS